MHSAMGMMYIIIGIMVISYQWFILNLDPLVSWALGVVFMLYGIFRTYRAYTIYKEE